MEISTRLIKDTIKDNGTELIRVNLKYPFLVGDYNKINTFYEKLVNNYYKYLSKELYKRAQIEYQKEYQKAEEPKKKYYFNPYSATINYSVTHCDEEKLSIIFNIQLFSGRVLIFYRRIAQVWNYQSGLLDFYNKRGFNKGDFYIKDNKICLFKNKFKFDPEKYIRPSQYSTFINEKLLS